MRQLLIFFCLCCSVVCKAQYFDTLHIRYAIGVAVLQPEDRKQLDSLATYYKDRKFLIYSYADYLGSENPNQHLSDNRANTVKKYLLDKGLGPEQILECTGLGRVPGSGDATGNPDSRRTDIFIRRKTKPPVPAVVAAPGPVAPASPVAPAPQTGIPVPEEAEPQAQHITRIDISSLKVNDAIRLENIEFYPGRPDILTRSYPELDNLYNVLHDNPKLKIRLEGHVCCCIYPDGFFKDTPTWGLSVERAYVVYKHMVNRGIDASRMQYEGFGRTRPIRDNETTSEEGQINRRVEVRILEK